MAPMNGSYFNGQVKPNKTSICGEYHVDMQYYIDMYLLISGEKRAVRRPSLVSGTFQVRWSMVTTR
nr:hypothetical protein Q903MT_gene5324 [Picea sitchensis]